MTSFRSAGAFAASLLTLVALAGCSASANDQAAAETYIRANISDLSPTPAVLGGTFQVTDIEWEDDDTAVVSYEDGHIALEARTDIVKNGDVVAVSAFTIVDGGNEASAPSSADAASSAPQRPLSKEGETCGGIAALQCEPSLFCKYDGAYPDAAGVCVK